MARVNYSDSANSELRRARAFVRDLEATVKWAKQHDVLLSLDEVSDLNTGGITFTVTSLESMRRVVKVIKQEFPARRMRMSYAYPNGLDGVVFYSFSSSDLDEPYVSLILRMPIEDLPAKFLTGKCAFRKVSKVEPAKTKEYYEYSCKEA